MNITVLGAGAWGTALAINLAARHAVALWARDPLHVETLRGRRVNDRYLPGCRFPAELRLDADLRHALAGSDYLVIAVTVAAVIMPTRRPYSIKSCPDSSVAKRTNSAFI